MKRIKTISRVRMFALATAALALGPAMASETTTYTYDSRGRLVQTSHSGTVNNGVLTCYQYDRADNRQQVDVKNSGTCPQPSGVTFSVSDPTVKEGGNLGFTVTKTGTASGTITVEYTTIDGTAVAGSDYTAKSGTLTFLATDTSKAVSVTTIDDAVVESSETALLNLSNASAGAIIADGQGVGTIQDTESDCVGVSFTVTSNGPATEGANSTFTVTKSGSTSGSCGVSYATANGTAFPIAAAPSDYATTSGTLTFTAAQTSQTVTVATTEDTTAESAETFKLNLLNPTNGSTLGTPSTAVATINDDDTCTAVSFTVTSSGAVTEGAGSSFTITKTGSSGGYLCSVNYATANGTAAQPGDYTPASGTLTFTSAQTSQPVTVTTINDTAVESAETFKLNLSSPSGGAALGTPNSATATINDNDSGGVCSGVSFTVNDPTGVIEGNPLSFTVSKTGSTSSSCTINYATADGTATAPTYYTAKSGTLTFSSTQNAQTVTITTIDRGRTGGTLNMYLNLTTASGGASISDSQGLGRIIHSDEPGCTTCLQTADPQSVDGLSSTDATEQPPQ